MVRSIIDARRQARCRICLSSTYLVVTRRVLCSARFACEMRAPFVLSQKCADRSPARFGWFCFGGRIAAGRAGFRVGVGVWDSRAEGGSVCMFWSFVAGLPG
jgi:hypothetical protein